MTTKWFGYLRTSHEFDRPLLTVSSPSTAKLAKSAVESIQTHNNQADETINLKERANWYQRHANARRARRDWASRFEVALPDDSEALLESMYDGEPQIGADGSAHDMDNVTYIPREQGMILYHLCLERKPEVVLETGLAYGFSTIFMLTALRENGQGRHIAIDPYQTRHWKGVGAQRGLQLGMNNRFDVIEDRAEYVIPKFTAERLRVQLVFIDGDHRFDSAMLDFTLAARLCEVGALIVIDDLWMPSIRCLVRYIETNRKDWRPIPSPLANIYILEKTGKDERDWNHFVRF